MCLSTCQCKRQKISILAMEAGYSTGKSLSEPLHFAENGENMLCTTNVSECQKQFLYITCSPQV